ncbi:pectinesterase inhibitor-like [Cucurbita moschata]|uniref:Pectinesterase inhibitor-like n=1 Tax=Cucurbita moschata TaxID=3662 RepID=A0A6J1EZI7_CUCMO|nr:pectinesterase inhibitor-like [Cucurbita moschata]XP_022933352.1 pectinesterase inhibitor-like [Cucurbita moschata]
MASSSFLAVFRIVLLVLFFNGMAPMHAASQDDIVSTICKKTRNPSFCFNVLKSAGTTDLKGLATFTLNLAHDKVAQTRALALSLASKETDPKLKERYATCAEQYDDAADDIEDGKNDLGEGDYNGVNIKASAAMTEVGDCLDSFTQPPKDPSALSGNGKTVEDICSIILVIANLLLGRA